MGCYPLSINHQKSVFFNLIWAIFKFFSQSQIVGYMLESYTFITNIGMGIHILLQGAAA